MALQGLYTIYDRVAEEGSPPFCARTDGVAIRQFMQAIQQSPFNKDDFLLYRLGSFNPVSLELEALDKIEQVVISINKEVES